jgi:hypothetical protein
MMLTPILYMVQQASIVSMLGSTAPDSQLE